MEVVRSPAQLQELELGLVRKVLQLTSDQKVALARGYLQIFGMLSPAQAGAILDPNGNASDQSQAREGLELFHLNHRLFDSPERGTRGFDFWEARQNEFYGYVLNVIPDLQKSDLSPLTGFDNVATERFVWIIAPDNLLLQERAARAFRWNAGSQKSCT